jgi:hypothetical protein
MSCAQLHNPEAAARLACCDQFATLDPQLQIVRKNAYYAQGLTKLQGGQRHPYHPHVVVPVVQADPVVRVAGADPG